MMEAAPSRVPGLLISSTEDENSRGSQTGLTCFSLEVAHVTTAHDPLARTDTMAAKLQGGWHVRGAMQCLVTIAFCHRQVPL